MSCAFEVRLPSLHVVQAEVMTQNESIAIASSLRTTAGPFNEAIDRNISSNRYKVYLYNNSYYLRYTKRNTFDQGILIHIDNDISLLVEFIMAVRYHIQKSGAILTSVLIEGPAVEAFTNWFLNSHKLLSIKQNPTSLSTSYFASQEILKLDKYQPYGVYYLSFSSYKYFNSSHTLDKEILI
jgi:hypothetical protein